MMIVRGNINIDVSKIILGTGSYSTVLSGNMFFITGDAGNVFLLRQAMKYSGFDQFLKGISSSDYLYIGYSAGSVILSKDLSGFRGIDDEVFYRSKADLLYEGLSLIDYLFIPHYQSNYRYRLIHSLVEDCKKNDIRFQAVRDGDVIIKY